MFNSLTTNLSEHFNMKFIENFILVLSFHHFFFDNFKVNGNYQVTVMEYEILVKNDTRFLNLDKIKLKRKSHNQTHKFYGDFILFKDLTYESNVRFVAELYKKQGGEYRKTAFHQKALACQFIDADTVIYASFAKIANMSKKVYLVFLSDIFHTLL